MGHLKYDGADFLFDDRLLAHLQIVISTKLRRNESFFLSWTPRERTGREAIWIDTGIPIHISYSGGHQPSINRAWIVELAMSANSTGGLVISDEPAREAHEG